MELFEEVAISLTVAEWIQIRTMLGEQNAAFQAQIARNNATSEKINDAISPRPEVAPKPGPQLVS